MTPAAVTGLTCCTVGAGCWFAGLLVITQGEILPALTEAVLYAQPPLDVTLCLNLPDAHIARLLRAESVEPGPARSLTADWTTRAHGTEAGAGAPPSPPGGGSRGDIVMSPLAGRALSAVATGSLRGYELVNQGGRGGALEAIFHSILDLCVGIQV